MPRNYNWAPDEDDDDQDQSRTRLHMDPDDSLLLPGARHPITNGSTVIPTPGSGMYKQKSPARVSGKNKIPEGFTPRDSLGGRKTSTPSCPLQKKRLPERDFESSEQPSKKQSSNRERQPNLSVAEVDPTLLGHGLLFKAPSNETQGKKKSAELMEGLAGGSSPTHISTVEVKVEKPAEKTYELPFTVYQKFQRRIGSEAAHDSSDELEVTNVPTNSIFHRRKNPVAAESDLAPTEWVRQKQKNEDLELEYFRRGSFLLDDAPDIFFTFGPDGTFEVHGKGLPWKKGTFSSKDIKEVSVAKTFDYIYIQLQTKYHEIPHGDSIVMKLKTSNEASIREIFKKHGIEMRENLYIWNKEQSFKESKQLEDDDIFPICNKEVCSRSPTEREPMRRGPPVAPRTRRSKNTPLSKNSAIEMELEREVPSTQRTIHGQVETHEQELGRHSRASTPPEWKTPLVWPPAAAAKKRVTVDYADLDRLDNEKWLNDNIINFYLRHLEEELSQQNPVLAQQTHFFNTFFYERLISRTADRRATLQNLMKWTQGIDLFTKRFLIIPINEEIHWYLAIICNLHHLEKRIPRTLEDSKDTVGTPVTQIEEDNIDSDISSECLADETVDITQRRDAESVTLQRPTTAEEQILSEASVIEPDSTDGHMDISKLRELDDKEWPNENGIEGEPNFQFNTQLHEKHEAEEIIHISGDDFEKRPAKRLKKSAKPKKPVKVDFERPTIFILDSLNKNSHSRTFTVLKEYIQEVALQTKGWEFSAKNHIAGSYAAVPMQPNWWDCGVYLLYYVETFLQRPESFQDQFLRKERSLSNYDEREIATMREKLRALIMRLHREQVSKPPARTGSSTPTFGNVNPSVAPKSPVKSPVRSERNKRRTSPGVQKTSVSDTLNGAGKPRRFTPEPKHFQGQDRVSNRTSVYFRETTPAEGYPPEAVSRHSSPRSLRSSSSPSASPTPRKNHSDESRQSLLLDKRKSPSRSTMEEACFSSEVSPKGGN